MSSASARILVGEDEAGVAGPLISVIQAAGHEVRWVRALREVRRELSGFRPALLVMDAALDADGLELFQALRFAPDHPPGGVVILTDAGDIRRRERAQQLGAAAVISKPVDGERFAAVVDDLLAFV